MTLELRVVAGARAGTTHRFAQERVLLGRDPRADLRFDAAVDLDVSSRHAEIRCEGGRFVVAALASRNGTFLNGARLVEVRELRNGDVLSFGSDAVRVSVHLLAEAAVAAAAAGAAHRARGRMLVAALVAVGLGVAIWQGLARGRGAQAAAAGTVTPPAAVGGVDFTAIDTANRAAVAMVVADVGDAEPQLGTGFGITADGLVVTNRHVVRSLSGAPAKRIAVLFADTRRWIVANVEKVSDTDDLALLRLDLDGPHPVVRGISAAGVAVGAPVATIGYPLGTDTPMEGSGAEVTARATLSSGIASKLLADLLQIDAFASSGSSGSPVFDREGRVVGVVYGGATEAAGRIVYAVPAARVAAFVKPSAPAVVR